ncbi:MAG: ABC transporter permease, partial [Pauljensenia sp.]
MNAATQLLGALIEAWGEVKVQKARVVLSLVGVVAAVAAMTVVIALGDLVLQSSRELAELYEGRSVTLRLSPDNPASGQDG